MKEKIVTCPNCGGNYSSDEEVCPYCAFETKAQAQRTYENRKETLAEERRSIFSRIKTIQKLKKVKKGVLITVLTVSILIILFAILVVGGILIGRSRKSKKAEDLIPKLEAMLEEKDYQSIYESFKNIGYEFLTYEKYDEVNWIWGDYLELKNDLYAENYYGTDCSKIANDAMNLYSMLERADEYVNDSNHLGNEENIKEILLMGEDEFINFYGLDNDTLEEEYESNKAKENGEISFAKSIEDLVGENN